MKYSILILSLIATTSCNKNNDPEIKANNSQTNFSIQELLGFDNPSGFICAYSQLGSDNVRSYDLRAYFKSHPDSSNNYPVGTLTCNNKNIPFVSNENNTYVLQDNSGNSPSFNNWLNNAINVNFTGTGSYSKGNFTLLKYQEFSKFSLTGVTGDNNSFNKNNELSISWNADSSNSDSVFIVITYDYETTKDLLNQNANSTSVMKYVKVPDNGICTLQPSFFSTFPNNSFNRIEIYRGKYGDFNTGTSGAPRSVGVLGYSKAISKLHIL